MYLLAASQEGELADMVPASKSSLRDFMDPTMDNTKHILNYLMPIIDQVNPDVHDFMQRYTEDFPEPRGSPLRVPCYCSWGRLLQHVPSTAVASSELTHGYW